MRNGAGSVTMADGQGKGLSEARAGLAGVLDGSPATVWAQDADLRYVWIFNPSMGLSEDEIVGKTDHELMGGNFADRLASLKRRAIETGSEVRETVKVANGTQDETHDLYIRPVLDPDGKPAGVACVSMQLPDNLMTLADEANHRIKNSLLLTQALLRMQRRASTEPDARDALRQAEGQIDSIARFHGKLAEGGAHGWVDIREYLESMCADLAESITETRQLQIETDVMAEPTHGRLALKLGLIVSELVTNAVKHASQTERPLVVRVSFARRENGRRLVVEDNGDGLPTEFDPGTDAGVGMRILKTLVAELQAEMVIDRQSRGARFVFDLADSD